MLWRRWRRSKGRANDDDNDNSTTTTELISSISSSHWWCFCFCRSLLLCICFFFLLSYDFPIVASTPPSKTDMLLSCVTSSLLICQQLRLVWPRRRGRRRQILILFFAFNMKVSSTLFRPNCIVTYFHCPLTSLFYFLNFVVVVEFIYFMLFFLILCFFFATFFTLQNYLILELLEQSFFATSASSSRLAFNSVWTYEEEITEFAIRR